MNRALGHLCAYNIGLAGPGEPGMVRRHCPPDTGFEIRALVV